MGYIEHIIDADETVEHRSGLHWIAYLPAIITTGVVTTTAISVGGNTPLAGLIVLLGAPLALLLLVSAFIRRRTTEIAVTGKRVIVKTGLIRRHTAEINRGKIEGVIVDQSVIGRVLGYGTIAVNGTGGGLAPVNNIDDPLTFRRAVGA